MQTLITGGTGFVGQHLARAIPGAVITGRSREKIHRVLPGHPTRIWSMDRPPDPGLLDGIDTVVHLAGESIFHGRWTRAKKERIRESRVLTTRHLVRAMATASPGPRLLLCASAVGIYGDRNDEPLAETSPPGNDFLATVCREWEAEALRARECGVRVVLLRLGVVLGRDGGALAQMLPPFRLGLGGRLGSGNQYMAWIHILDLCRIIQTALQDESLHGPLNAVAPTPVTNRVFTRALARAVRRPAILPVPAPLLRLVLGEFATVLLASQRAVPEALAQHGFTFHLPDIDTALADLLCQG
jgi:uncharacterized protein (TIGR01777 family)